MKKIFINKIYLLTLTMVLSLNSLFFQTSSTSLNAQSEIFLTSYWYLDEGEINGSTFPGVGVTFSRIDFSDFFQIDYYLNNCKETIIVPYIDLTNQSFILEPIHEYELCNFTDPADITAIELSRSLFFENPIYVNGTPKNPFTYAIIPTSYNDYELLITNADGGWALFTRDQLASTNDFFKNSFTISPNPTSEVLFINNGSKQAVTATIYDINGKNTQKHSLETSTSTIDVESFNPGLYFVVFENETGERVSKKFVKN